MFLQTSGTFAFAMWISARTALTLAAAALLLVVVAVAAPLMPRPHLPPLPAHRAHVASKFGEATAALDAPERVRSQRMETLASAPAGGAHWAGRVGVGAAATPPEETITRLRTLLKDARTVADPRAERAAPAWVVRFVRDAHRVDVMVDLASDRLVVVRDGALVGAYAIAGLHREFADLASGLERA